MKIFYGEPGEGLVAENVKIGDPLTLVVGIDDQVKDFIVHVKLIIHVKLRDFIIHVKLRDFIIHVKLRDFIIHVKQRDFIVHVKLEIS